MNVFFDKGRLKMKIRPGRRDEFMSLTRLWESSVRATHHFLKESDIAEIQHKILNRYLPEVTLRVAEDASGSIAGFIGLSENKIEMLFVAPQQHGKGIGRELVEYAVANTGAVLVDVNEQNTRATAFYEHVGFEIFDRSELDGEGRPFPVLHMRLAAPDRGPARRPEGHG